MGDTFSWLHFSDLHWGSGDLEDYWGTLHTKLVEDISLVKKRMGIDQWDALFFTGDLAFQGKEDEFTKAKNCLERVKEALAEDGSSPVLLPVPGNHDLQRPPLNDDGFSLLSQQGSQAVNVKKMLDKLDKGEESAAFKTISKAFSEYCNWLAKYVKDWNREHFLISKWKSGAVPGDYAVTLEKNCRKLGVIGLNSAFLHLQEGNYQKHLLLHVNQLTKMIGTFKNDWFDGHVCNFLLTHHPPEWLSDPSRDEFYSEIAPPGRFVLHLCGHQHKTFLFEAKTGGNSEAYRKYLTTSLFGKKKFQIWERDEKKEMHDRRHGYGAGMINFSGDKPFMRVWPRLGKKKGGNQWGFDRDTFQHLDKDENNGGTEPIFLAIKDAAGPGPIHEEPHPEPGTAETIRERIQREIAAILSKKNAAALGKAMAKQFGQTDATAAELAIWLTAKQVVDGVLVMRTVIKECLEDISADAAFLSWDQAEKIVGWLVLLSLKEKSMADFLNENTSQGTLEIFFRVETHVGVEILLARLEMRRSMFVPEGDGGVRLQAPLGLSAKSLPPSGWETKSNAEMVLRRLWKELYKEDFGKKLLAQENESDLKNLQAKLRVRHRDGRGRFLVVGIDDLQMTQEVLDILRKALPYPCLRQVIMRGELVEIIFIDDCERDLQAALEDFFELRFT